VAPGKKKGRKNQKKSQLGPRSRRCRAPLGCRMGIRMGYRIIRALEMTVLLGTAEFDPVPQFQAFLMFNFILIFN